MNRIRKMRERTFVIDGMMLMRVFKTTFPYDLSNRTILKILNALMTVTPVLISMPKLRKFIIIPTLVPITIKKSNLFQADSVRYLQLNAVTFRIHSILKIIAKM